MNDDELKLEMWKEIMRQRGEYVPGYATLAGGGSPNWIAPPNAVSAAETAVKAFNALFARTPKPAAKKRR